jgi:hypothetical protein
MAVISSNLLLYDRGFSYDLVNFTLFDSAMTRNIKYLITGLLFGIVLVKSEVISWFRIQEMFRLQAFHMYGIIGSAIITGLISVLIIKHFQLKTIGGENITIPTKKFHWGNFMAD